MRKRRTVLWTLGPERVDYQALKALTDHRMELERKAGLARDDVDLEDEVLCLTKKQVQFCMDVLDEAIQVMDITEFDDLVLDALSRVKEVMEFAIQGSGWEQGFKEDLERALTRIDRRRRNGATDDLDDDDLDDLNLDDEDDDDLNLDE